MQYLLSSFIPRQGAVSRGLMQIQRVKDYFNNVTDQHVLYGSNVLLSIKYHGNFAEPVELDLVVRAETLFHGTPARHPRSPFDQCDKDILNSELSEIRRSLKVYGIDWNEREKQIRSILIKDNKTKSEDEVLEIPAALNSFINIEVGQLKQHNRRPSIHINTGPYSTVETSCYANYPCDHSLDSAIYKPIIFQDDQDGGPNYSHQCFTLACRGLFITKKTSIFKLIKKNAWNTL